jgi:hypothetical protein
MSDHFEIELFEEPNVEFGSEFVCDDPKMGIAVGGFYSQSNNTHKREINIGIISTDQLIVETLDWIKKFENRIVASETLIRSSYSEIKDGEIEDEDFDEFDDLPDEHDAQFNNQEEKKVINKKYNPDFIGFASENSINCIFQNNEGNNRSINKREFNKLLQNTDLKPIDKLNSVVDLYVSQFVNLIENKTSDIDVCYIVIPTNVVSALSSIKVSRIYINLRRKLKARLIAVQNTIPTQLIIEPTIKGTRRSLQDFSMTAWNFCIASYYKAGCIPWALQVKDTDSCFIGISFNKIISQQSNELRSSIAQAFNREGHGLVFTWKNFLWEDEVNKTKSPHLEYGYAKDLIQYVLNEYKIINKHSPSRVVIHKTTDFWDKMDSPKYNELEGFRDGIIENLGQEVKIDFVSIKSSSVKILRNFGIYPVPRGTCMKINDNECILYTTGYIPYFELYPGMHIPHPLHIKTFDSDSHIRKICEEIMALTKMNFNNCSYFEGLPITILFSKKVGEILQYLPENVKPQNKYFYYM